MQGLVNIATAVADGISVLLPTFCYLAACICFFYAAWTFRALAVHQHHHQHWQRPWVPFVSLILCGVFASFTALLNKANVSAGTGMVVSLTTYAPTTPPNVGAVLGATPTATVINVVTLFEYFFEAFGAACVFWAVWRWRSIVNGTTRGSPFACAVQFVFGVMCINSLTIATGIVNLFTTGA